MNPNLSRRELLMNFGSAGMIGMMSAFANQMGMAAPAGAVLTGASAGNPLAVKPTHFKPRAKRLIHLFMNGGPSQVDTFDHKPALTKYAGKRPPEVNLSTERRTFNLFPSPWKFKKYGQSGLEITELMPNIGECADDLCVIRSMHTDLPNHAQAASTLMCGNINPIRPCFGSWMMYGLGTESQNLPGFITLCPNDASATLWGSSFLPGIYQGCQVNSKDIRPKTVISHLSNQLLAKGTQREQLDLIKALNQQHLEQRPGDAELESRIHSMEVAFRMQAEAPEAFDLSQETEETRKLYGKGDFNNGCLLARRLVERGVRVVQVHYGTGENWDSHASTDHQGECIKRVDQPIGALLKDLKRRGLLEDTLVLWSGEFGRTPTAEGNSTGRDHNHYGFSLFMAGGGVKGGMAYGATDEFGFTAVENKVHVHDLHATILHQMGLDHEKLTYRYSGRDFRLTDVYGKVVKGILS